MDSQTVEFDVFQISIDELRNLPIDHVAAFAALSFAVTEVNILRNFFLTQSHAVVGDRVIDDIVQTQKLVMLRTWSSKLFDAIEFFDCLLSKKAKTKDEVLIKLARDAKTDFDESTSVEGYQVARDVRHEMSNHYLFEVARKNVPHVHRDALCSFFIHEYGGNDFYPIGEAVMFHGRLHRKWDAVKSIEARRAKLDFWFDWCIQATDSLLRAHAGFAERLIFIPLGRNELKKSSFEVPESFVGHHFNRLTPVIYSKST